MNICVIPARGGSKRIPRKNIRLFCGKPIISWSIEAAKASGCFDRIIVSTDDNDIREVAINNGAEVPFLRPYDLSSDNSCIIPVISHAADYVNANVGKIDAICCLFATAPFVLPSDLIQGLEALKSSGAQYAFSVTTFPFPIQRAIRISNDIARYRLGPGLARR